MLPLHIDPALILSGPPRLSGGQSHPLVLVPGEAVQATVLAVPDEGALLVLIKGVVLQASSLVGRLAVGQVLEAQVEVRDGQTLLRLDQPVPSPGVSGVSVQPSRLDAEPAGAAGQVRLAALLRQVLPADGPLAGGLARLADSLARAVEQGHLPPQTLAGFEGIRRQVLLEGQEGGRAVPPARLEQVLRALGLSHEHDLLSHIDNNHAIPKGYDVNLKSWLIEFLAGEPDPSPLPQPGPPLTSEASPAGRPVPAESPNSPMIDPGQGSMPLKPGVRPEAVGTGNASIRDSREGSVASRFFISPILASDEGKMEPVPGDRSGQGGAVLRGEMDAAPEPVAKGDRPAARAPHDKAAPALVSDETPGQTQDQEPDPAPRQAGSSGPSPRSHGSPASPAAQAPVSLEAVTMKRLTAAGPTVPGEAAAAATQAPEPAWIRDAQHLLSLIERTQALSGLNAQTGQPVCFDFPLAWGGQGQARIYVDTGEPGGQGHSSGPRPYNVVTLLDLDGLGAVRVDAVLTGKRLAARFLLDRPQVEAAVAARLPALSRSLSAKGYQVDVITSGTGDARLVRGADLEAKAAPRVSLLNCRA